MMATQLSASVFVAPSVSMKSPDGRDIGTWPPIACTLIYGPKSAVLVNTPFTRANTRALVEWISATLGEKRLMYVYISHGLGDFWFGLPTLRKRFPGVKVNCTRTTLENMKTNVEPQAFHAFASLFPGHIEDQEELAEVLPSSNKLLVDGHELEAIPVGQGAVPDSTVLWIPSLRMVVCGAVVYGDGHPMLANCPTKELRQAWITSIEKIEQLGPMSVVSGHQKSGEVAGVWHLQRNKEYIETFGELIESGKVTTADHLVEAMKKRYPDRFNVDALVVGAEATFSQVEKGS